MEQGSQPDPIAVYTFADEDIFGELAPEQRAQAERAINLAEYPSGQIFYAPEESGDRLYILRRGRVRIGHGGPVRGRRAGASAHAAPRSLVQVATQE